MHIVKALIPTVGHGESHFLPFDKAVHRDMLPIITKSGLVKPAIQLILEEAAAAALSTFLMITRPGHQALNDFLQPSSHTSNASSERTKRDALTTIERLIQTSHFNYIHQHESLGIGHALWLARHYIGKEYCAILLPNDLIMSEQPCMSQLIRIARQERASVIAVQEVPDADIHRHSIIGIKRQITPNLFQVANVTDKPDSNNAPSNLAVIGRYVLSSKLFTILEDMSSYATDELLLGDAISGMLQNNERVFAYKIHSDRFDLSTPTGWMLANMHGGMQQPDMLRQMQHMLRHEDIMTPVVPSPIRTAQL